MSKPGVLNSTARRKILAADQEHSGDSGRKIQPPLEAQPQKVARRKPTLHGMSEDVFFLLKTTATQWVDDKCPQLGAALAYFTVFSLAPLILILLAFFGLFFGSEHARDKIIEQLQYLIDPSGIKVIQDIATSASKPQSGLLATTIGHYRGVVWRQRSVWSTPGGLKHHLGCKSKTRCGIMGLYPSPFLILRHGGGRLFSAIDLSNH